MEGISRFGYGFRLYPIPKRSALAYLRVNADMVIDTDDDALVVCETLESGAPEMLAGFPHGEIVKFEILSQGPVSAEDAETYERERVE